MKKTKALVMMVMAGLIVFSGTALAVRPPDAGNGGGDGDEIVTPDYGDLIMLYRNENGVPYLTEEGCWQPLPSDTCPVSCTMLAADGAADPPDDVMVVMVNPDTCAIPEECAPCAQEVDFGRMNEVRSSEAVFESQLADVVVNLATADCVTLDPAGRLVTSRANDDDTVTSSAIDSPLQNLAIYRQLMMEGYLGNADSPIDLPADVLVTATRALGAASDKTGEVNVDMVVYINQIIGLADAENSYLGSTCIEMKEEVMGVVQDNVQKCFLNYDAYEYAREDNFSKTAASLPSPAYIPAGAPNFGWFEYLYEIEATIPTFGRQEGPILDAVFCVDESTGTPVTPEPSTGYCANQIAIGYEGGNIGGFAQAADDTRAVIDFMHSWPLPADYTTPLECEASEITGYDLSISSESGLQVPEQMVDGSEGREFIVTVANAGPDKAIGTVKVEAFVENGGAIFPVVAPENGIFYPETNPPCWVFDFTLAAGRSQTFPQLFSVDTGAHTSIIWTATAEAEDDVNTANNTVTATTNVRVTGGGARQ